MKNWTILAFFLIFLSTKLLAQREEEAIKTVVTHLFTGMKTGDSTLSRSAFAKSCIMQTIVNKNEKLSVRTEQLDDFIKFIGSPHKEKFDERIVFSKILIDGPLATVWTDYKFYIDEKFSHCGVNSFQLAKLDNRWQIVYLIDTRRKDNCSSMIP
ncbi:MAG: nuclear transport factor 2 family protein [Pedobacter agri]|uniref:nuclear transport factor 2 family protein n=1 Tax=Pedobacter agri TaxID=454586 RepID=UPI00277FE6AB|nr:nuclear transport factor 2 family protein [Pedobacter agri]MDQ1140620.1 hypothetical protein [Pedobacter agri]